MQVESFDLNLTSLWKTNITMKNQHTWDKSFSHFNNVTFLYVENRSLLAIDNQIFYNRDRKKFKNKVLARLYKIILFE